jgi:N-acetylgalactosamine 4-sulfate 6-O-sulfotransferase
MHITSQIQNVLAKSAKQRLSDREASAIMSSVFQTKPTKSFVCVPQVYFMGFPRSGSTQLYKMLAEHPLIRGGMSKEPHWWTKADYQVNFPHDVLGIVRYFSFFQLSFEDIEHSPGTLLMDGSQSTIWDTRKTGNLCFLPQIISELFPAAKFIVIMRDPIQRLYSDFTYLCQEAVKRKLVVPPIQSQNNTQLFHEQALTEVKNLRDCVRTSSLEYCTHRRLSGSASSLCGRVRLGISLYHVHIRRWLREIPRSQFLFLRTDDLAENPYQLLRKVWRFLGLAAQNMEDLKDILHEHFHSSKTPQSGDMAKETEILLREFFQPHNDALVSLLEDESFRWSGNHTHL